ncbi:MAG: tetratricopeptide repeat protein [Deltaproteobacteria bacterium]|nr:tetratricopeptide repeat protein [Deltaproteobacteria bacterium]MBI3389524.1 tetratricopeptide repeat protein [Deltaproteobacteria bacterium]
MPRHVTVTSALTRGAVPLAGLVLTASFALRRLDDFDTWWHLAAGRWMAQHRAIPVTDPLAFPTADHRFINLSWLFDLLLYGLHQLGGPPALVVIAAVFYILAIVLLWRMLRATLAPILATVLALWVLFICQERFAVRPEMVTFALIELLLWVLTAARRCDGRYLWGLPVLMVVWFNLHSLAVIGSLIIGCHLAAAVAAHWRRLPLLWRTASVWSPPNAKRLWISGTLALLTPLVNPYGLAGALFPLKLFSFFSGANPFYQQIGELHPPFSGYEPTISVRSYQVFFLYSIGVVLLAAVLSAGRGSRPVPGGRAARRRVATPAPESVSTQDGHQPSFDMAGLLVFVLMAYVSLLARRNVGLFALATAPFVAQCTAIVIARLPLRLQEVRLNVAAAMLMAPAMLWGAWFVASNGYYRWNGDTHEFGMGLMEVNFPIQAAEFVKELQLPGRLFNDVAAGNYLAWAAPIAGGVYIDGRLGLEDPQVFGSYLQMLADPEAWETEADHVGIQTVVLFHRWPSRHVLIRHLNDDERWALVYIDETAIVFVRRAGHEALLEAAVERFSELNDATVTRLMQPASSWQWPMSRAIALQTLAGALVVIGNPDAAVTLYTQALTLGLPGHTEAQIRLILASDQANQGNLDAAREQLHRAEQADPHNEGIAELRAQIDG